MIMLTNIIIFTPFVKTILPKFVGVDRAAWRIERVTETCEMALRHCLEIPYNACQREACCNPPRFTLAVLTEAVKRARVFIIIVVLVMIMSRRVRSPVSATLLNLSSARRI